jgi:hypothetical protein
MSVTLHFAFCILHFALPLTLLLSPMSVTLHSAFCSLHFALLLALLLPHSSVLRSWSETSAQSVKSVDDTPGPFPPPITPIREDSLQGVRRPNPNLCESAESVDKSSSSSQPQPWPVPQP